MAKDPAFLFSKLESDGLPPTKAPSVYAVLVRNQMYYNGAVHVIYIGRTLDPDKRRSSKNHPYKICLERFPDHLVCFQTYPTADYIEDEKILIQHYKPVLNKQHTNG